MTAKKKTDRPPIKKAVALRYDLERENAPRVIGTGSGKLAERLIELAREHDIPIQEDSDLVEILSRLNLNEEIPPSTYIIVSEILAFIYRTNEKYS
ncbi:MAG: EscU/YscU/HrcU family type III secretion system export apparatus switch protein [Desulfobulbaceae bacterium]|nr:EscU/YscU/HrcU family type III secretion system export apparatus switch protein [Desulfobulbaceae bacterium]